MATSRFLAGVLLVFAGCGAGAAHADGFLEKPGAGKVIATLTFERDAGGTGAGFAPLAAYRTFGLTLHAAYGLSAATTLIARTEGGHVRSETDETQMSGAIGVRRLLFDAGALRVTAQALASAGGGLEFSAPGLRSHGGAAEARLAATLEFSLGSLPAFVTASAGPRVSSSAGVGARAELGFGVRPRAPLLLLAQLFAETDDERPHVLKAQASAIYDLTDVWSVQAGAFATLTSGDGRRPRGALAGLMRRF